MKEIKLNKDIIEAIKKGSRIATVELEVENGNLIVQAFSKNTFFQQKFICENSEDMKIQLDKSLLNIILNCGADTTLIEEKEYIKLKSGKVNGKFKKINEKLPEFQVEEPIFKCSINDMSFIEQVKYATSKVDVRPIIQGVNLHFEEKEITAVALDGYRIARRNSRYKVIEGECCDITVHANDLEKISLLNGEIIVCVCKKTVIFVSNNILLGMKLLEGSYIKYDSLIPKYENKVKLKGEQFKKAITRMLLLENSKIELDINNGYVQINSNAKNNKETKISEKIISEKNGADCKMLINAKYLKDIMDATMIEDDIIIQYNDSKTAINITDLSLTTLNLVLPISG